MRFAARNDVGLGEWSDEMKIETPRESSPEPPKFITPGGNVGTYPDRFQIRWTVPLDNGRKIDVFELRYFEVCLFSVYCFNSFCYKPTFQIKSITMNKDNHTKNFGRVK